MFQRVNIVTLAFFILSGLAFSEQDVPVPQVDPELSKNTLNKAFLALQEAETPPLAEVGGKKQVVSTLPHFQGGAKNPTEGLSMLHILPEDINIPPKGHDSKQVLSHADPASFTQVDEGQMKQVFENVSQDSMLQTKESDSGSLRTTAVFCSDDENGFHNWFEKFDGSTGKPSEGGYIFDGDINGIDANEGNEWMAAFNAADGDESGTLSKTEFQKWGSGCTTAEEGKLFDAINTDGSADGIDKTEWQKEFDTQVDKNPKDGEASLEEFFTWPRDRLKGR